MMLWYVALLQLAKTKAADIESLLQQLSDINHDMSGVIAGAGDARSHTLARHRDILTDLTQVGAGGGGEETSGSPVGLLGVAHRCEALPRAPRTRVYLAVISAASRWGTAPLS
jgi:hypothetical protein